MSSLLSGLMVANIGTVRMFFVWACVGFVTCICHLAYAKWVPPIKGTSHKRDNRDYFNLVNLNRFEITNVKFS